MAKLMYNQKWLSLNEYSIDYLELVNRYYATCGKSVPATYYNLDLPNSVYDSKLLGAGSYELMGDLSGYLWKKITLLQVFNFEPVQFTLQADESGTSFKDRTTSVWFPTIYELVPSVHDFVCYDYTTTRDNQFKDKPQLYEVVNIEKAGSTELTFWKATLKSTHRTKENIEAQLSGSYSFSDYEKHIYKSSDAILLDQLQCRNGKLKLNNFYKEQVGLYVETSNQ